MTADRQKLNLYKAVLQLQTMEECEAFFKDLCTIREIQDISQRLEVASLLMNKKNYLEIFAATGASTATICRVSKCLNFGEGGYRTVLNRLGEGE